MQWSALCVWAFHTVGKSETDTFSSHCPCFEPVNVFSKWQVSECFDFLLCLYCQNEMTLQEKSFTSCYVPFRAEKPTYCGVLRLATMGFSAESESWSDWTWPTKGRGNICCNYLPTARHKCNETHISSLPFPASGYDWAYVESFTAVGMKGANRLWAIMSRSTVTVYWLRQEGVMTDAPDLNSIWIQKLWGSQVRYMYSF